MQGKSASGALFSIFFEEAAQTLLCSTLYIFTDYLMKAARIMS
jgi:hypothetical protein